MKVLVINAGSSSLKYQLLDMKDESVIAKGGCERIGMDGSFLIHKAKGLETKIEKPMPDHSVAIDLVLNTLTDKQLGVVNSISEIDAFGHRVLHGGELFTESTLVNDEVIEKLKSIIDLGPLHMKANIMGVEACRKVQPNIPNVVVFDTSFHRTMPKTSYMYAVPYEWYENYKVRRYGFHGSSHKYVSQIMIELLNKPVEDTKIVTCHLGNGSSCCAVKGGKCLDTSMGLTPLEGMVMGTRCGDIDPAVLEFVMKKNGMSIEEMTNALNKKSGLLGVSGVGSDMRDILAAMPTNDRAKLAFDMLAYRVKKYIGAYSASMNGLDAIVFTAGIGEYTPELREQILKDMDYLGIDFDNEINYNAKRGAITELSTPKSKVKVYIIPTNEELVIARDTIALVK